MESREIELTQEKLERLQKMTPKEQALARISTYEYAEKEIISLIQEASKDIKKNESLGDALIRRMFLRREDLIDMIRITEFKIIEGHYDE